MDSFDGVAGTSRLVTTLHEAPKNGSSNLLIPNYCGDVSARRQLMRRRPVGIRQCECRRDQKQRQISFRPFQAFPQCGHFALT